MLPLIAIGIIVAVAKSNVIPSHNLGNNVSLHTMTKRENYQSIWSNNNEPLEICPAIEASLAPSIESRFCDVEPDNDDELDKYFVTVGDVQGRTSWLKDKNHKGNIIKNRNFDDYSGDFNDHIHIPLKSDMLWTYDKSFAPDKDVGRYLVGYTNPGYTIIGESSDHNSNFFGMGDLLNSKPVGIENFGENYEQIGSSYINDMGVQQSKVAEQNIENRPIGVISPATPTNDGLLTTESSTVIDATPTGETQQEKISGNIQPTPGEVEQKRQEATMEDLERTNELMNEILDKLKEVQDFEQIEKNIKTFVDKLKSELPVDLKGEKQAETTQVNNNSSSTIS